MCIPIKKKNRRKNSLTLFSVGYACTSVLVFLFLLVFCLHKKCIIMLWNPPSTLLTLIINQICYLETSSCIIFHSCLLNWWKIKFKYLKKKISWSCFGCFHFHPMLLIGYFHLKTFNQIMRVAMTRLQSCRYYPM